MAVAERNVERYFAPIIASRTSAELSFTSHKSIIQSAHFLADLFSFHLLAHTGSDLTMLQRMQNLQSKTFFIAPRAVRLRQGIPASSCLAFDWEF